MLSEDDMHNLGFDHIRGREDLLEKSNKSPSEDKSESERSKLKS